MKEMATYKNNHLPPNTLINSQPRPPIRKRILAQHTRRLQCLEGKLSVAMIPGTQWMSPGRLPYHGPDVGFLDVGGGFVVAGEEFHV